MKDRKNKLISQKDNPNNCRSILFTLGYSLVLSTILFGCRDSQTHTQQATSASNNNINTNSEARKIFRVVRAKQLVPLALLEKDGNLEKRLNPLGYKVEWEEFAAGPQQLEAMNAGGLDIALTAESPPIFAEAAGSSLVYLAANSSDGKAISLLVPFNSPVKSIRDLKGKKIASQKASIGHYLIVKALQKAGLKFTDIQPVYLQPSDANAAFSQGKVDAWFIWEPFVMRNEKSKVGRVLLDGGDLRDSNNFYSTTRQFYQENTEAIKIFLDELQKEHVWAKSHPKEMAQLLTSVTKLDPETLENMHKKYEFELVPITNKVIETQQKVADIWYDLKLIPKKVNVRECFLTPEQYAQITPPTVLAKK
jgi:sulfonate transport system substrate-binding protein